MTHTPPPETHVRVRPLKWDGNEARSLVGRYRVQRLDDKWEPLHDGYYMLSRLHGMVKAFDTFDQAKEHAEEDYRKRVLSVIEAPSPQTNVVGTIDCPCTTFEQDEDCPVGYPSLLCAACDGKGIAPIDKVVAFAAEMMKVADQVGELEDPFAAWETIDLIKSQHGQMRKALKDARALLYSEHGSDGRVVGVSHEMDGLRRMVALLDAVLAATEESYNG